MDPASNQITGIELVGCKLLEVVRAQVLWSGRSWSTFASTALG